MDWDKVFEAGEVEKTWKTENGECCVMVNYTRDESWRCGYYWTDKSMDPAVIDVHGGVTFYEEEGDGWIYGFDCCHSWDRFAPKSLEYVVAQIEDMVKQVDKR